MKKVFMMLVLFVVPFAMQAQTFHDVEANDAKGPVKSITTSMMGQSQKITFTQDGKQEGLNKAVYDDNGYLKSAEQDNQMGTVKVTYKWENGKIKSQTMDMMGQQMPMNYIYNEKGELVKQTMSSPMGDMTIEHSDYKYDDRGNWISRKTSVMGQSMETPRTIEYY
ncbi:MAG: hypothetical protein IKQ77_13960 [Prevotella sp.]|nr:hypothetical protein [Prevotella sp.]